MFDMNSKKYLRPTFVKELNLLILKIIGDFVNLKKVGEGNNWKGVCCFHKEIVPSLIVNEKKKIFNCFGCGKGGDAFDFIMGFNAPQYKKLTYIYNVLGVKVDKKYIAEIRKAYDEDKMNMYEYTDLPIRSMPHGLMHKIFNALSVS